MRRRRWMGALLVLCVLSRAVDAGAQAPWSVATDAFADAWYHTLALVGDDGFGALPLYDHSYAARHASRADARLAGVRALLERDSSYEVVHFVPLSLRGNAPDVAFALARQSEQLAGIRDLVDVAQQEWTATLRVRYGRETSARTIASVTRTRRWRERFLPALQQYLTAAGIRGGTIIVSPPVGREGRVLVAPDGAAIVVVGGSEIDTTDVPLLAAVRELAFPAVRRVLDAHLANRDRVRAEILSDVAATRAGEMLLAAMLREAAPAYRALYGTASAAQFTTRFPLDPDLETRLRREVFAMAGAPNPASP